MKAMSEKFLQKKKKMVAMGHFGGFNPAGIQDPTKVTSNYMIPSGKYMFNINNRNTRTRC